MLATIYLDDKALFKADEVENEILKWDLATKLELREPSIAQQSPHTSFSFGGLPTHLLREIADALGDWSMIRCLWHEPLTRRLRRHPLPQGERVPYTRIGIRT